MNLNNIPERQNTAPILRLLKAREHFYAVAANYQYAQLLLSVVLPFAGAVTATLNPDLRAPIAVSALLITLLDISFLDRMMRKTLVLAAQVSEELDCALLNMPWNSFIAGRKVAPEAVSTAAANCKRPEDTLLNWYPVAVGKAPFHLARLICQHTNLWYDGTLRRTYSAWILRIGILCALAYTIIGFRQHLSVSDWVSNMAIGAPIVIWVVREYFRQRDTSDAVQGIKSNGECVWDDALARRITDEETKTQSREFQNGIFVRRSNNPLLFPFIYKLKRKGMEKNMDISAEDRLKAIGLS